MIVASLNSGSNGNCYYLGTETDAVLIDAGLSWKQIRNRMGQLDLDIGKVRGVFISHEHSDHVFGLRGLFKNTGIPVYITEPTLSGIGSNCIPFTAVRPFRAHQEVDLGTIHVTPFPISHDAADPHNFLISSSAITAGIFTDLGYACPVVRDYFSRCQAVFLETNYEEEKLRNSNYPAYLKERISGDRGHLSNLQALELFRTSRNKKLSHVFLSHLSAENNSPELAMATFADETPNASIHLTSRYGPAGPYKLGSVKVAGQLTLF